jgi:tryptophan synthase alpha chain
VSRVADAFQRAKRERRAAFVAYVTAGDPNLARTVDIGRALARAGTDVLELGVPFSDPIADGTTNQRAAERALAAGTTLKGVLAAVDVLRTEIDIPIVLFTYANPVVRYGIERFAEDAARTGVDGVLFTDVPAEEMVPFEKSIGDHNLDLVMLVTPTSTRQRMKAASRFGGGLLYVVSRTGVTGTRTDLEADLADNIRVASKVSSLPVAVGFGISTPEQVTHVAAQADGVVVGSAIVNRIAELGDCAELGDELERFVAPLAAACKR